MPVEDSVPFTPEMLEEIVRLNQCCPRFNREASSFLGSVDKDRHPDPAVVEKYAIPAFLRK
jgi:hypothetical protein